MEIAASRRSQQETRFDFSVTFIVMAEPVPAISRGTLPPQVAGASPGPVPAMTVRAGFIQGGSAGRPVCTRNDMKGRLPCIADAPPANHLAMMDVDGTVVRMPDMAVTVGQCLNQVEKVE